MSVFIFSVLSVLISCLAIYITTRIFFKIFDESYKLPWFYIGIAAFSIAIAEFLRFFHNNLDVVIFNSPFITLSLIDFWIFIANCFLFYGLFLEYLILKYQKGKYVRMKFIPIKEGTLSEEIDLNVEFGHSYIFFKKNKNEIFEILRKASNKDFEAFFLSEENPKSIRKIGFLKSPIAWIYEIRDLKSTQSLKTFLDENCDLVDPFELNNILNYILNFLENSKKPIIYLDLDLLVSKNNYPIINDFFKYLKTKIEQKNGILLCNLKRKIEEDELDELKSIFEELEA